MGISSYCKSTRVSNVEVLLHIALILIFLQQICILFVFLGSDINLCDRPIQENGELEPWKPDCPYPPSGKELAVYLAQNFPPQLEKVICPDSTNKGSLHIGGEVIPYLSQYAYLTKPSEFDEKLQCLDDELGRQEPNQLHRLFATMIGMMRDKGYYPPYPLIVTTNYDRALEKAFEDANEPFDLVFYSNAIDAQEQDKFVHRKPDGTLEKISNPNQYHGFSFDQRPVILKLYGTVRAGVSHHIMQDAKNNLDEYGTPEFAVVVFNSWQDNPLTWLILSFISLQQKC